MRMIKFLSIASLGQDLQNTVRNKINQTYCFLKADVILKVFLHGLSASLKHVLDAFDLGFEVLKLVVLALVRSLQLHNFGLQLFFLWGALDLTVFINQPPHRILLSDLFDLTRVLLDLLSADVYLRAEMLASGILIFEKVSVVLHGFVLAVGLPEFLEGLGPVSQFVHRQRHI